MTKLWELAAAERCDFAGKGKGKSGGYRTITFYGGRKMPMILLTVFAKGQKVSLSASEKNGLKKLSKTLHEAYKSTMAGLGEQQ